MRLSDFRNISAFSLYDNEEKPLKTLNIDTEIINRGLTKPIGLALSTSGLVPLLDGKETELDMTTNKGSALRHRVYSRILPSHVIKDELNTWATEYEKEHGEPPTKIDERNQRLRIETELTPKAFIKHKDTFILRSYENLVFTTATENLSDTIRTDFWELPEEQIHFKPFFHNTNMASVFDLWAKGQGLDNFEVDPEGSFQLTRDRDGAKVLGKGIDVSDKRFTDLLEQGYRVTQIPLIQIESEATFRIDTNGRIRGLNFPQFTNVLRDELGDEDSNVAEDLATLSIMRSMILALLLDLKAELTPDENAGDLV